MGEGDEERVTGNGLFPALREKRMTGGMQVLGTVLRACMIALGRCEEGDGEGLFPASGEKRLTGLDANELRVLRTPIMQVGEPSPLLALPFELSWKTLKAVFEDEGLKGLNSPKTVLREAYAAELIKDDELWLAMLSDRNSTAHIYSEQMAIEICRNIQGKYVNALVNLLEKIHTRLGE